jgi:DNA-binding MarR family transcriptional regulator
MKDELKQDLLHSLFCFKKVILSLSHSLNADGSGLSAAELSALGCIEHRNEKNGGRADKTAHDAMHETLAVSKAAVSQMLGSLEKRGYIQREIDLDNRRRIIITLTKKGKAAVDKAKKKMDTLISLIVTRFGEENSRNFVELLNRFVQVVDDVVK